MYQAVCEPLRSNVDFRVSGLLSTPARSRNMLVSHEARTERASPWMDSSAQSMGAFSSADSSGASRLARSASDSSAPFWADDCGGVSWSAY